jgi:transposase-like protein
MGDGSRTADGRRCWRQWTESEARVALADFARSGQSLASFAREREVSCSRLRYWRKRLGEASLVPSFVQVRLPRVRRPPRLPAPPAPADGGRIEIVVDEVSVRVHVPAATEVGRLAALVRALAGLEPAC